jgi:glutathione S-transferase
MLRGENEMKLYQANVVTTCPRRVTIYMAEKGIKCEVVELDMRGGAGRTAEFRAKNPAGRVPVLQLDDGTYLPDSMAIIEYLEEKFPDPPLIGRTPEERAFVRSKERLIMDFQILFLYTMVHGDESMEKRRPEFVRRPELAEGIKPRRDMIMQAIETVLGDSRYFGGNNVCVADISLYAILDTGVIYHDYKIPDAYPRLQRWFKRFGERPSARRN